MYLFALEDDNTQLRVGEGAIPDLSGVMLKLIVFWGEIGHDDGCYSRIKI